MHHCMLRGDRLETAELELLYSKGMYSSIFEEANSIVVQAWFYQSYKLKRATNSDDSKRRIPAMSYISHRVLSSLRGFGKIGRFSFDWLISSLIDQIILSINIIVHVFIYTSRLAQMRWCMVWTKTVCNSPRTCDFFAKGMDCCKLWELEEIILYHCFIQNAIWLQ